MNLLTNQQKLQLLGQPGDIKNLVAIDLPYPMYTDWGLAEYRRLIKLGQKKEITKSDLELIDTNKLVCHKLVAEPLKKAFAKILATYGYQKIRELGIDELGGCYLYRAKRGYERQFNEAVAAGNLALSVEYLSTHSWGAALDLDADRNTLRETHVTARFARPEYKAMIDIFYEFGFVSYGREKDYDWMHFEAGPQFLQLIKN